MDPLFETPPPRRRSRAPLILLLVASGLVVWGITSRLQARADLRGQAAEGAAPRVLTVQPESGGVAAPLVLPATVEAWTEAPIYARTNGYLRRWLVDIGTPVKAGQLLAEIETPEVDAQLQQALADLGTAKANYELAASTARRWRDLLVTNAVSRQDADTKTSAEAASLAALHSSEANVARLRQLAGFKRVVAPFDGVVTARDTDVGALIGAAAGTPLFKVADTRKLRLYVQVPQAYAASIKPGLAAEFSMSDHPGMTYPATVVGTASSLDSSNRSLRTQLSVDNTDGQLLAGGYAEVHLQPPPAAEGSALALRIPANALLFRAEGLQVVTVDAEGKTHLKNISIARDLGSSVEIASGLSVSDQVVLNPPDSIAEGIVVQATPAPKAAPKA